MKDVRNVAYTILDKYAERDEDGNYIFRGTTVDIFHAISELDKAEIKLMRLLPDAIDEHSHICG